MRFATSVFIPLALFADTALCKWDWPWKKPAQEIFKPMQCDIRIYTADDTKSCFERAKRLFFHPATDEPITYPKLYPSSPQGDDFLSQRHIVFPMFKQEAWTEGQEPGIDRCFIDSDGNFAGVFYMEANPSRTLIEQYGDQQMSFAPCTEIKLNTDKKRMPAWHNENVWEKTGDIPGQT
ncbi:hypothetical protein BUE80_DR011713 [Diplocarpon rosae]|nr:hypothetical protein BUE80_DR011713 [Diplocarpon rosae]